MCGWRRRIGLRKEGNETWMGSGLLVRKRDWTSTRGNCGMVEEPLSDLGRGFKTAMKELSRKQSRKQPIDQERVTGFSQQGEWRDFPLSFYRLIRNGRSLHDFLVLWSRLRSLPLPRINLDEPTKEVCILVNTSSMLQLPQYPWTYILWKLQNYPSHYHPI